MNFVTPAYARLSCKSCEVAGGAVREVKALCASCRHVKGIFDWVKGDFDRVKGDFEWLR